VIFGEGAGASAWEVGRWLLPAALVTGVVGFIGVLSARGLRELAAFAVVGSIGVLLAAASTFQPAAMSGALYYLASATLAGALLFLLADMIARQRVDFGDTLRPCRPIPNRGSLAVIFLLTAMAVVGLPPLSGFIGKLLILDGVGLSGPGAWVWWMVLGTTLLAMVAFARAGSVLFWKTLPPDPAGAGPAEPLSWRIWASPLALLACLILLSVAAGPVTAFLDAASAQLFEPEQYRRGVLGP